MGTQRINDNSEHVNELNRRLRELNAAYVGLDAISQPGDKHRELCPEDRRRVCPAPQPRKRLLLLPPAPLTGRENHPPARPGIPKPPGERTLLRLGGSSAGRS
jgi:hypothetical protein